MDQKFLEQLAEILPEKNIYINEPMNKHTTFRIGGSADVLVTPGVSETAEVLRLCKNHDIPVTIIGNGSNLLVGDQGIRGVVIEFGRRDRDPGRTNACNRWYNAFESRK